MRIFVAIASVMSWLLAPGCASKPSVPRQPTNLVPPNAIGGVTISTGGFAGGAAPVFPGFPGVMTNPMLPLSSPAGVVVRAKVAPAPINGGTLLITKDGRLAVAADPDRDRVVIVDLDAQQVLATTLFAAGEEPGRLIEDGARRVHVVLRRAGAIAAIDLEAGAILSRRSVCATPQGIAYADSGDLLHVACSDGQLVTLPAAGGDVTRRVQVDSDLRDVIVAGDRLFVTRFKSAELLELDADAAVRSRQKPGPSQGPFASKTFGTAAAEQKTFETSVAWRTVAGPDGRLSMLHQLAQVDAVALDEGSSDGQTADAGTCALGDMCLAPGSGQPAYGSIASGCSAIVLSGVSTLKDGTVTPGPVLANAALAVDAAVSPDGQWLAVAVAGNVQGVNSGDLSLMTRFSAVVLPVGSARVPNAQCISPGTDAMGGTIAAGQAVAVAFDPKGRLVLQTREPNRIRVLEQFTSCWVCMTFAPDIDMGGEARRDTGHDLFHGSAGVNLACASCHPGGGDDGRTWVFGGLGPRRTRPVNIGIRDTLPLFWKGELATFDDLLAEVFVKRMGGHELSIDEARAIEGWLASLHEPAPMRPADDPAAVRGRALFESADVGCTGCHSGPKLTNNMNEDVGTGGAFQVPSLLGVAYHQPLMHGGCGSSLRKRFDPSCGGAAHGNTAGLSDAQIDDLAAYLESL